MNLLGLFMAVVTAVGFLSALVLAAVGIWVVVVEFNHWLTCKRNNRHWREITAVRHAVEDDAPSYEDRRAA